MHLPDNLSTSTGTISAGDHDDAIIRVASNHRRDFDLAVIHFNISQVESSGFSFFESFGRNPVSTLGALEALPLELLATICLLLDLQSAISAAARKSSSQASGNIARPVNTRYNVFGQYSGQAWRRNFKPPLSTQP